MEIVGQPVLTGAGKTTFAAVAAKEVLRAPTGQKCRVRAKAALITWRKIATGKKRFTRVPVLPGEQKSCPAAAVLARTGVSGKR